MKPIEVLNTEFLPQSPWKKGKVRDIFDLDDRFLFVTSDRISAFDVVLPQGIPGKGVILNQISRFWFEKTEHIVPNHLITTNVKELPKAYHAFEKELAGRITVGRKIKMIPVECVARGYLVGSGYKEYRQHGTVGGFEVPPGLEEGSQLPEILFTPSTKAEDGHDVNLSQEETIDLIGEALYNRLREITVELFAFATDYLKDKEIIIADTKFEFGWDGETLTLADEMLTPDSSRFWPRETYKPGKPQESFDKQFVRDYLESLDWNKQPPAPELPQEIIDTTFQKYLKAYQVITGQANPF